MSQLPTKWSTEIASMRPIFRRRISARTKVIIRFKNDAPPLILRMRDIRAADIRPGTKVDVKTSEDLYTRFLTFSGNNKKHTASQRIYYSAS